MAEIWSGFLTNFLDDTINISVYLAIAALFALCFVKCVVPVFRTRAMLRRAIRSIRAGEKSKRSWQEDSFLGKGALYPHWSEYLDNLFFADGEYHNASNVEDYINEETAIAQPGRAALASAAPGIMVSLGFLGTLLGITQGLAGFSMENSEAVMDAIRTLIPGMKYAFTTSIVGVVGSILFTVVTSVVNGSAKSTLSNFYAAMHNDAGVLTVDPLNQIAIYQQEQTAQIQSIASDLTGAMAERFSRSLEGAFAPMRESLDAFCEYTTQRQTQALDIVVTRFIDRMNATLNGQFQELASCIQETVRWQKRTQEGVGATLEGISRVSRDVIDIQKASDSLLTRFDGYMASLSGVQGQTEEAYSRIAANVEQMEIVARQQTASLQSIGKLQGEIGKTLSEQRAADDEQARSLLDSAGKIASDLNATAAAMRESGQTLTDSHKAFVVGVNEDLERTYNAFFADIGETTKKLEWMVEDVKATMERLPAVLDETANLYADQGARLTDALRRAQESADFVADKLSGARRTPRE